LGFLFYVVGYRATSWLRLRRTLVLPEMLLNKFVRKERGARRKEIPRGAFFFLGAFAVQKKAQ
jgi:hypothetical protein